MIKKIAVLGGDKRSLFAARDLTAKGMEVRLAGFDRLVSYGDLVLTDAASALSGADAVLLPVAGVKDGVVGCPFSENNIDLYELPLDDKIIFAGRAEKLFCRRQYNIAARDDFSRLNALPTAEGALAVAIESYEDTISGSRCLVIGYGRIGAELCGVLSALGADVSASTRRRSGKKLPEGINMLCTENIETLDGFDMVFNTADSLIIDRAVLERTSSDPLIIDLASLPGGVDFDSAEELGFTALRALALPGRYSPAAAGRIISDTILAIADKEEYIWQKQT